MTTKQSTGGELAQGDGVVSYSEREIHVIHAVVTAWRQVESVMWPFTWSCSTWNLYTDILILSS